MLKPSDELRWVSMSRIGKSILSLAAALIIAPAAHAQLFLVEPQFPAGPIDPSEAGFLQPLPNATPDEQRANIAWTMRAGLNVAALQCQFSPLLRAVPNYNQILRHHSVELEKTRASLAGHFNRINGRANGARAFDQFTTRTYNAFSTFYGQLGFCLTAAKIGRQALGVPKGSFTQVAAANLRELMNSLKPAGEGFFRITYPTIPSIAIGPWVDPCIDRKGRRIKRCIS